ncbi:hypothetical protein D9M70_595040 [compost metagenome]
MHDVLGQRRVAHQPAGHAKQTRTFLHIQGPQSLALAPGTGGEVGFVVENGFGQ